MLLAAAGAGDDAPWVPIPAEGRVKLQGPAAMGGAARRTRDTNKNKRLFLGEPGALKHGQHVTYRVGPAAAWVCLQAAGAHTCTQLTCSRRPTCPAAWTQQA
jgi:hypothetical protein